MDVPPALVVRKKILNWSFINLIFKFVLQNDCGKLGIVNVEPLNNPFKIEPLRIVTFSSKTLKKVSSVIFLSFIPGETSEPALPGKHPMC